MNSINKNINFETIPDQIINTKEIFGIECAFKVFSFKIKFKARLLEFQKF